MAAAVSLLYVSFFLIIGVMFFKLLYNEFTFSLLKFLFILFILLVKIHQSCVPKANFCDLSFLLCHIYHISHCGIQRSNCEFSNKNFSFLVFNV